MSYPAAPGLVFQVRITSCVPVPESDAVRRMPVRMLVTLNEAERLPLAEGVNKITTLQLPPNASDVPQVLFSEKLLEFVPVNVKPERLRSAPLMFDKVIVSGELATSTGWFPKLRLPGERLIPAPWFGPPLPPEFVPVPERGTDCGLLPALSLKVTTAVRDPRLIGANWTLIMHPAPAARLVPQLLLSINWFG